MPLRSRSISGRFADITAPIALAVLWAAIILIVDPRGDFALNDSWSYAQPVKSLLETGDIRLTPWTAMPLLGQVAWGAMFASIFGYSFEVLRASTLVIGLIGIWAVWGSLREMNVGRGAAAGGAALVALNPLYINLAHTFMTDVPFAAALACSTWLALRGFRTGKDRWVWAAVGLAVFATWIRQAGLLFGLALSWAWGSARPQEEDRHYKEVAPFALCIAALALHWLWMMATDQPQSQHNPLRDTLTAFRNSPIGAMVQSLRHAWSLALISGVLIAPAVIVTASERFHGMRKARWRRATAIAVLAGVALAVIRPRFPDGVPNILFNLGVGPLTFRDTALLNLAHWPAAPGWLWIGVNAIGGAALGFATVDILRIAAGRLGKRIVDVEFAPGMILCGGFVFLYGAAVSIQPYIFDRYTMPLIPMLLVLLLARGNSRKSNPQGWIQKVALTIGVAATIALGVYGALGTRDYFSWNRARIKAIDWLVEEQGATPAEMDAGFEYSLANLMDIDYYPPSRLSWWWVRDDRYLLVFDRAPGEFVDYEQLGAFPYRRSLPPSNGSIRILKRKP